MRFSLIIQASPLQQQAASTALRFAQALLSSGHQLHRVFFYRDGVYTALNSSCTPADELNLPDAWQAFARAHEIDLVVCIAAGVRRGVISEEEAHRYGKHTATLAAEFDLSGLGQLIEATLISDRIVTFGGRA